MTTTPGPTPPGDSADGEQAVHLGTVGGVSCWVRRTQRPWELDIDGLVLSTGRGGFGNLGRRVEERYQGPSWESIPFDSITADEPHILTLDLVDTSVSLLRTAILTTPHSADFGLPTDESIAAATTSSIHAADRVGVHALGMPLLATGVLAMSVGDVSHVMVPAAIAALRELTDTSLRSLVFFGQGTATVVEVRVAWAAASSGSSTADPSTTDASTADPWTADFGPTGGAVPTSSEAPGEAAAGGATGPPPTAAPRFSASELAGGVSSDLVDPSVGIPPDRDHLGVSPYVSMLATVIADRRTPPPLSVGIFGEWGSGKSYFMGLLRHQVTALAATDSPQYCGNIAQIGFNAWHYADSNLWASLGDEIFRQLAEPAPGAERQRRLIHTALAPRLEQRKELEAATRQAAGTVAALRADVETAAASRGTTARRLIAALRGSRVLSAKTDQLWRRLGIEDQVEQANLLAEQMHGGLSEAEVLRRVPRDRRGKLALATSVLTLLAIGAAAVLSPTLRDVLAAAGGVTAVAAGVAVTVLTRARAGLRQLRELAEDLHAGMDRAAEENLSPAVAAQLTALRMAEADQRVAEAQLGEVVAHVGELGRQLAELAPGRRLYGFLAERAQGSSYSGNLGLISTIRKDFESLVELLADWQRHPDETPGADKPLDRIVLYIDDLDRCSPRQVVDVLQAVHLLLALELFVVVIGVDPRWVLRSLRSHYDVLHGTGATDTADPFDSPATPENYLEKIINIPVVLPTMESGSLLRLLRSVMDDSSVVVEDRAPAGSGDPVTEHAEPADDDAATSDLTIGEPADASSISVEAGSEVDAVRRGGRAVEVPRPLTEPEVTLLAALDLLVDTPREAKRLMNLYRMVRATRDLSAVSRFLGDDSDDGDPGEYQAVAVLLGLLTANAGLLGRALDAPAGPGDSIRGGLTARPADSSWERFVEDFDPQHADGTWTNGIVGTVPTEDVRPWRRLHGGLRRASAVLTIEDLSSFQHWAPRIRRFSYMLTTTAGGG